MNFALFIQAPSSPPSAPPRKWKEMLFPIVRPEIPKRCFFNAVHLLKWWSENQGLLQLSTSTEELHTIKDNSFKLRIRNQTAFLMVLVSVRQALLLHESHPMENIVNNCLTINTESFISDPWYDPSFLLQQRCRMHLPTPMMSTLQKILIEAKIINFLGLVSHIQPFSYEINTPPDLEKNLSARQYGSRPSSAEQRDHI